MKRLLVLVLSAVMVVSIPVTAFAASGDEMIPNKGDTSVDVKQDNKSENTTEDINNSNKDIINSDESEKSGEIVDNEELTIDENLEADENELQPQEENAEEEIDYSVWTSEDFTYGRYSKRLYGCDYSRDFTITGSAITGFSETGLQKLEKNTDLVIPATDDEGDAIVGVAEGAFSKKGLTSVKFPTGMLVDYDDTVTHRVTKRGNFIIGDNAFSGNNLTQVNLPEGVIACLVSAFANNQITSVRLPKTIWWIETMAFANNRITAVNFPTTCDFQLEMHGMPFAKNFIKSVRLPDFTEVVNKTSFVWNTGMEPLADGVESKFKSYSLGGETYQAGVVYMYTDNAELEAKDRIHHTGRPTESQHSDVQKLVVNDGSEETQNPDLPWNISDFVVEGTVIKGLSASGIEKRKTNKNLVIPDMTRDGQYITEIASAKAGENGLFATNDEKFDSVALPNELEKVGNYAFQNSGISEVTFPSGLKEIGISAFAMNNLTSVILPDTVTKLGGGAFATNPNLERINLSKGLTEIPAGAFGCSDKNNWMEKLTSIELHEGITSIGDNAFAGNNFSKIVLPSTVKSIGRFAFSTKNYLATPCEVTLNEGLETIGSNAFRNKVISEIALPTTVKSIKNNTFTKEYSDATVPVVTKVFVSLKSQYEDKVNFPASDYHKVYLTDASEWTADDFTYKEQSFTLWPAGEYSSVPNFTAWVVAGLSETGQNKLQSNTKLVIPDKDPDGRKVQGVADNAFKSLGLTELVLPTVEKAPYDDSTWSTTGKGNTERGDFFIGSTAFFGNKLTSVDIPEGVIYIGYNSFCKNMLTNVKIPKSVMQIAALAFARNNISSVEFPEKTEFAFQMDNQAFAINKIKAVQLPSNTEKVTKWVFIQNTGMEQVTSGTTAEKKGGVVYMYKSDSTGQYIEKSNVQKLIVGTIPGELAPWGVDDFTYDLPGTTVTGLSEQGKSKLKNNPVVVIPEQSTDGAFIRALGDGQNNNGIFTHTEDGKNYAPAKVFLPSTLKTIGKWTFALSPSLTYENDMTDISLPDGLVEIGQTAFQNSKLTSVSIPDSVTTMGMGTFTGSADLTSVKLSKNVADIPQAAFNAGTSVTAKIPTIEIPEGVKTIGDNAFTGMKVENLTLPSTLVSIGRNAFQNHQIKKLVIPENVTSIGNNAFRITQDILGNSLTSLTLPEGLLSIGTYAFAGCGLSELELPASVTTLEKNSFKGNKNASGVVTLRTSNTEHVDKFNNPTANKDSHVVVYDNLVGTGWNYNDFTYDENTGTVTGWSEQGNEKRKTLKTLVIPCKTPDGKDVIAIGDEAFKIPDEEVEVTKFGIDSPNGMTEVILPEKLEKIGAQAFSQNALKTVDLEGITSIGERAFYGNDLVEAIIPDTVTEMGDGAFATNDITKISLSKNVTVIPQGAFSMNIRLSEIDIPDTVTEIGDTAFAGARLTSLTIPKSVVKIGRKAFHLHHLTELTIPGNVKEIGESAFEGTYKATTLKKLVIEDGVETIGRHAFKEGLLETVDFPNSIKEVGEEPFLNNSGKDKSNVVEVISKNKEHEKFGDDTFKVVIHSSLKNATVTLDSNEYTSTGSAIQPKPVVTLEGKVLKDGVDYVVEYKNNVNVGTATIVVKGIGDYFDSVSTTFTIKKASSSSTGGNSGNTGSSSGSNSGSINNNGGNTSHRVSYNNTTYNSTYYNNGGVGSAQISEVVDEEVPKANLNADNDKRDVQGALDSSQETEKEGNLLLPLIIGLIITTALLWFLFGRKRDEEEEA